MSRNHEKLNGRRWAKARQDCFARDGWRCRRCGQPGRLEAHHEPPLPAGGDPYALDGLRTLCRACHVEAHRPPETEGRAEWRQFVADLFR